MKKRKYKTSDGEMRTIDELAILGGISKTTAYQRIKKLGWTADETIAGAKDKSQTCLDGSRIL